MGLGYSLFARHYSGSRGFFPFLRLLRCFSSPACHCSPYVFRREHARITTRRFPHSEIPGSKVGQHLTRAYRSRPRPSSALSAKASTVCSCSLDRKEHVSPLWSFQGAHGPHMCARLSKLNSVLAEVDVVLGGPDTGRSEDHRRAGCTLGVRAPRFPRKEVIQPQLPLRLPCYDFTPIINPTFDGSLPQGVRPPASGVADFRGVTGGVYKARERIHRGVADPRLLATPTSWRRVSASNPNRDRLFGIRSPSRVCSPLYRPM
jgi:hypothetical protein